MPLSWVHLHVLREAQDQDGTLQRYDVYVALPQSLTRTGACCASKLTACAPSTKEKPDMNMIPLSLILIARWFLYQVSNGRKTPIDAHTLRPGNSPDAGASYEFVAGRLANSPT